MFIYFFPEQLTTVWRWGDKHFKLVFYDSAISWLDLTQKKHFQNDSDIRNSSEIHTYLIMSKHQKETNDFVSCQFINQILLFWVDFYKKLPQKCICGSHEHVRRGNLSTVVSIQHAHSFGELLIQFEMPLFVSSSLFASSARERGRVVDRTKDLPFYDIISDTEINIMKALALPALKRAEVAEYNAGLGHRVSDTRVTKIEVVCLQIEPIRKISNEILWIERHESASHGLKKTLVNVVISRHAHSKRTTISEDFNGSDQVILLMLTRNKL
ncbi:hypothetical protein CEXT_306521 [Caerostris extrusa]|uniref:Uncharacterized protein n=1 Tax=Caerostris extrusa TaxID=172846 RepID=A0AAV4TCL2_CAEEX|nr:hypothetical protein CEXT_306521 [Caerostris extrusa]